MKHLQDTLDFIHAAKGATDMVELEAHLRRTLENFGISQYSLIALVTRPDTGAKIPIGLTRACDPAWSELYHHRNYFNYDIVIHSAIKSPRCFSWESFDPERLSANANLMLAEGRDMLKVDGCYVVPVHEQGRFEGLISLFYPGRMPDPDMLRMIKLVAMYALEKARNLTETNRAAPPAGPCPLSARQREALAFSAIGKTDGEVADILGISEKTANHHFQAAKLKLGVATRAQAVAIAVNRGWLAL